MIDVAIIGGGVSGLTAALELKNRGRNVVVLERQARAGGNAISESIGGFLMEHGPSTVSALSDVTRDLSCDLGLDADKCNLGDGVKERYLVSRGRLCGIPVNPMGFFTSNYLSVGARLRMFAEPFIRRGPGGTGETIAGFCTRRFGREFTERVMDPLVGGIYSGRADQLSVSASFPKLLQLERDYGSISYGMLRRHLAGGNMPGNRLFSWRGGIGTLPGALAAALGSSVRTGVAVRRIARRGNGYRIDAGSSGSFDAGAVIIATQSSVAARLLEDIDADASEAAAAVAAPPIAVVFLGYLREQVGHPLDGLGFLAPRDEGLAMTGAQFCSTMFENRAPDDCVAVAGYFGGARAAQIARLPADELIALARSEFGALIAARGEPVLARVRHWPMGLPQYEIGHEKLAATLGDTSRRLPGLFVTGNFFTGPGVANCVEHATATATEVDAFVRTKNETTVAAVG